MTQERPGDDYEELADYYDNTEMAEEIEDAVWEETAASDPMITTSVRLPRTLLERIRVVASGQGIKTSVLMRRLIEQNLVPEEMGGTAESFHDLVRALVRAELTARAGVEPGSRELSGGELSGEDQVVRSLRAPAYSRFERVAGETLHKRPVAARKAGRTRSTTPYVAGSHRHVPGRREAG